jgi:hypothetical protein
VQSGEGDIRRQPKRDSRSGARGSRPGKRADSHDPPRQLGACIFPACKCANYVPIRATK